MKRIVWVALLAALLAVAAWGSVSWLRQPAGRRRAAVLPLAGARAVPDGAVEVPGAVPDAVVPVPLTPVPEPVARPPATAEDTGIGVPPTAPAEPAEAGPVVPGPHAGSALPLPDGSAPAAEYTVKAKSASRLFHSAASPYFRRTRADMWFRTEDDALAAGFRSWRRS